MVEIVFRDLLRMGVFSRTNNPVLVAAAIGIGLTILAVAAIQGHYRSTARESQVKDAADHAAIIARAAEGDLELIHSVVGFYAASRDVERH